MRTALVVPAVAALLAALASPALAGTPTAPADVPSTPWSAWKPIPSKPATLAACGTKVRITFPVNEEEERTRSLPAGATAIEVRGGYTATLTPEGHPELAVTRDVSGETHSPNYSIAYANGDFLYRANGHNLFSNRPSEQASSGLPELAVTDGPVSILFSGSKKGPQADVIRAPRYVLDVCKKLTAPTP